MPHNKLWRRNYLPILQKEKTEAPRCGVRHITSINSGSCGSSINSSLVPGPVPQLLTCPPFMALAQLLFLELPSGCRGRAKRSVSRKQRICFTVWSLESLMFCILSELVLIFFCNITLFLTLHFHFPSFLFLIPVALDNGQKWSRGSVSFGCIKSFLHREEWMI